MKIIDTCLVCGSSNVEPFLVCKDYTVSQTDFQIQRCTKCNFKFTSPRPDDADLGKYYKAEGYISHSDTKKGLVNKLYHAVRSYTLLKKLQLVTQHTKLKNGKILDYGAGTGAFLNTCKTNKWDAYGIEPDDTARGVMKEKFGIFSFSSLEDAKNSNLFSGFDVITAWHVLEHVPDLKETITTLRNSLKDKGVFIVAVPNPASYDAKHYKQFWAAYDLPRHLWHFEPTTITKLFSDNGFNLDKTIPMVFDSFYVSMLSEKYKTGSSGLLKAFLMGLISNIKANKTGKEFSSQIFVFRKTQ
ncbi:MAG: class I SAM-dependent methyltransferase [Bacteroidia bacterium]